MTGYADETEYDYIVCCFCDNQWAHGTVVCPTCHEYKGLMTQEQWDAYLGDLYNTPDAPEPERLI
jgi:hypothetical protein